MSKFCIFCGNKPENKNKEHIIPQWLSKHTNRFHKVCEFDESVTTAKIPFSALTFPACTKCNDAFGKLEAAVKPILLDLMDSKPLDATQISLLLDWFDKIRVGLWLSELTLSKKVDKIDPKFHINDRLGQKDRVLIIERLQDVGEGLAFVGTNSPLFVEMPSAFALIINDFVFVNASEYGLVSNKLGFPQFRKMQFTTDRNAQILDIGMGRHKTTHPVVSDYNASPTRTLIYQPMFRGVPEYAASKEFTTPYVLNHSLNYDTGTGGIFIQRGDNQIKYLDADKKISLAPRSQHSDRVYQIIQEVFKLQNHILSSRVDIDSGTKLQSAFWRNMIEQNNMLIGAYQKTLARQK